MSRLSLNKADKLLNRADFDAVRRDGKKAVGPAMLVLTIPAQQVRCGVICSRKFSTRAVRRNRARRLLWESFRLLKPRISPCGILLIPRRKLLEYSRMQATEELGKLLIRRGVLTEEALSSASSSPRSTSTSVPLLP